MSKHMKEIILVLVGGIFMFFINQFLSKPGQLEEKMISLDKRVLKLESTFDNLPEVMQKLDAMEKYLKQTTQRITQIEDDRFLITLQVQGKYVKNNSSAPIEVIGKGDKSNKVDVNVVMRSVQSSVSGYNVHLFQKESGVGVEYYYQGSAVFSPNQTAPIAVSLGERGDFNKTYQILAIVNQTQGYKKVDNIFALRELPDPPKAILTVKRIQ